MPIKPLITILLVEDEDTDAYFVQWALKNTGLTHHLSRVSDGQEAVDYLLGHPPFSDRSQFPLPDLILLDLKMPRLDGFDVLKWVKDRTEWQRVPIVVLTSSQHQADVGRAQNLGAHDYLVKPGNPKVLAKLLSDLLARWLEKQTRP